MFRVMEGRQTLRPLRRLRNMDTYSMSVHAKPAWDCALLNTQESDKCVTHAEEAG